jgi:DNA-binding IclR family transcriptional regulator
MARPLSANSLKVLRLLGQSGKSLDELSAVAGIRKDRLAKLLWHLERLGWIAGSEEMRRLPVYRRLRTVPARRRPQTASRHAGSHVADLYAAFGIRLPAKRRRGRVVRASD